MQKAPFAIVKEKFGDKAKLVEAVKEFMSADLWVNRLNQKKGLEHVSNAKLLRLHRVFSQVKAEFGSREKLIDAILVLEGRTKDAGFRARLDAYPVPRLYDLHKSAKKRAVRKPASAAAPAALAVRPAPGGGAVSQLDDRVNRLGDGAKGVLVAELGDVDAADPLAEGRGELRQVLRGREPRLGLRPGELREPLEPGDLRVVLPLRQPGLGGQLA
jgi:hypothetical protein